MHFNHSLFWPAGRSHQRGPHKGRRLHSAHLRPRPVPETGQRPALLPETAVPGDGKPGRLRRGPDSPRTRWARGGWSAGRWRRRRRWWRLGLSERRRSGVERGRGAAVRRLPVFSAVEGAAALQVGSKVPLRVFSEYGLLFTWWPRLIFHFRHTCICASCFDKLDRCPMCRGPIKSYFCIRGEEYMPMEHDAKNHHTAHGAIYNWLDSWNDRLTDFLGFQR